MSAAVDAAFDAVRPRLFGIAYRMTGSATDADDLCQEAWLRWSAADRSAIDNPEAYLVRVITRLAIDLSRSAARRREQYVGPSLPEPILDEVWNDAAGAASAGADPADAAALADSLTFAFLVLLDDLAPAERAVFLLHDVFGYPFDEVAHAVDRAPAAVRQIAARSRRKLERDRVELIRPPAEHEANVIGELLVAISAGDVEAVMARLAPDIVQLDDGGPRQRAARRPIVGPFRVARLWINLAKRAKPEWSMRATRMNGQSALVFDEAGVAFMTVTFAFGPDGLVRRIHSQLNPDKLAGVNRSIPPSS